LPKSLQRRRTACVSRSGARYQRPPRGTHDQRVRCTERVYMQVNNRLVGLSCVTRTPSWWTTFLATEADLRWWSVSFRRLKRACFCHNMVARFGAQKKTIYVYTALAQIRDKKWGTDRGPIESSSLTPPPLPFTSPFPFFLLLEMCPLNPARSLLV